MKQNEKLTSYSGGESNVSFNIRTYDSLVEFETRPLFEHKHSDLEISLIMSGEGLYHFKDGTCKIHAGDIFVLGSNQMHCITDVYGSEQMVLFNIQMEARLFWSSGAHLLNEKHLKLFNDRCTRIDRASPIAEKLTERILELREETISARAGYKIRIYACLMSIIGELIPQFGEISDEDDQVKKPNYICMERAMKYIDEHLSDALTLEDVAAYAGYSRSYFSSLFTSLNGLSPWDYITIKRINLSRNLLLSTDLPITEIAERCGYSSLSNFNRHFRRLCGTSPKKYAQEHREIP